MPARVDLGDGLREAYIFHIFRLSFDYQQRPRAMGHFIMPGLNVKS
jgi:hypothetical protein